MKLTKTLLLAGLQCHKHLHLSIYHPELAESSESPAIVTGKVVGEHARREYPGGIFVDRWSGRTDPFLQTTQLINDRSVSALFEAGFQVGDVEVFVDILERAGDQDGKKWNLIEVKASTEVKDEHIDDIAIQALVLGRAGIPVHRIKHMHINKEFIYQGNHDYTGLFIQEDVTDQIHHHLSSVAGSIQHLKEVAAGPRPERRIGSHCKTPYTCEYLSYCTSQDAEYPIAWLPRGGVAARNLIANGIYDIRDIPYDALTSETHLWVRRATIAGEAEKLPGARAILDALAYPRYYLDFESIQFAIPIWAGTKPYQQIPFQWSCHIQHDDGSLQHEEFLDTRGHNPRRAFAEAVIKVCGEEGPIVVYHQAFEKMVLSQCAEIFPDLSDQLLTLKARVFDLLPVVKQHYYHPAMKGSWSLKSVLPCLAPDLRYADNEHVQDGTQAQAAYLDIISGDLSSADKEALCQDLREYCKLDTLAMVKIANKLSS